MRWGSWEATGPVAGAAGRFGTWEHALSARALTWLAGAAIGWDLATGVPSALVLAPVEAAGSVANAADAERHARAVLGELLPLLAPGCTADSFTLRGNDVRRGLRTVVLQQTRAGLPVVGAELSVRFRADRLFLVTSTAIACSSTEAPTVPATASSASSYLLGRAAADAVLAAGAADAAVEAIGAPVVLPVVSEHQLRSARTVVPVTVTTNHPRGRWEIYVDPLTTRPFARRSLLWHAQGTLSIDAPVRHASGERAPYPAPFMAVALSGEPATTGGSGEVDIADGPPLELVTSVSGPRVLVANAAGAAATATFSLDPGGEVLWSAADNEFADAQLSAFIHTSVAKEHAATIAPELASWLEQPLHVEVNVDDVCNAFYDGYALHFFRSGAGCANTARVADVVYHEFGHALHHRAMVGAAAVFDEALSEGLSDYFTSSLTGDPGMGRGFFGDDEPLRDIDPQGQEARWPTDISDDPHLTGLIMAEALWDLRKALQLALGTAEGAPYANELYLAVARGAADIPSSYLEVLAADDDDGDLLNGTPHSCVINEAFGAHGLRAVNVELDPPSVAVTEGDGTAVSIRISGLVAPCDGEQVAGAWVSWRLRDAPDDEQTLEMTGGPEQFSALLPQAPRGHVVEYRVSVELGDGGVIVRPENAAAPYYELYVGPTEPLYCTDFEADPWLEGWTHGLSAGQDQEGADDWQWDSPRGTYADGDPTAAFSGERVLGNDLGHGDYNGMYQPDKTNWAATPAVDVGDFDEVRLQYRRWLNVEDGYYDQATIFGNDVALWTNANSNQGEISSTHHTDREWRFHDVDLSGVIDEGQVTVRFELQSDGGLELGGWTVDDLCIVGVRRTVDMAVACGDGRRTAWEQCDDGNLEDGDGCDHRCRTEAVTVEPEGLELNLVPVGGCGCELPHRGPASRAGWLAMVLGLAGSLRRRSKPPLSPTRQARRKASS